MDKWNREGQNQYTNMTAQRRYRRRTDPEKETMQKPDRTAENDLTAEEESLFAAYMPPERKHPAEPEAYAVPDELTETEEPARQNESEEQAEPEKPEKSEKAEETKGPEEPGKPEAAEKSKEAAEPDEPEEAPAAVQSADSRVPPEARRMAAAPYGTARPEARRPGTRPQAAPPRKPVQNGRQTSSRPRPRNDTHGNVQNAAAARIPDRNAHVRVGYAPGRMSDDMTQSIPMQEAVREQLYSRDAKAYLEKRSQPFRTESSGGNPPDRPSHKLLRIAVALLIVIGVAIAGVMVVRNRQNGDATVTREAPKVISFDVPATEGLTAPVDLIFSAETEKSVDGIRLRGEGDTDLDTEATSADNEDVKLWMMRMHVETGFEGTAILQVHRAGEEAWYDTDYTAEVNVTAPLDMVKTAEENPETDTETPRDGKDVSDGSEADPDDDYYPDDDDYYPDEEASTEEEESTGEDTEPENEMTGEAAEPEDNTAGEPEETPAGTSEDEPEDEFRAGALRTVQPTETPAPKEAEPTETPPLTAEAAPEANPDLIVSTTIYTSFTKKEKAYSRPAKELIHMPAADEYTTKKLGVMTFRGDNFRRNAAVGTLRAAPEKLTVLWETEAGSARGINQTYYGYGWTGQPVIARWSTQVRAGSNLFESKQEAKALKEVIIAGMDGVIRFLDLEDGKITRNSIKLGYPMRGTPSLHTRGYPFMSVGQFARKMKVKTGKIGLRQYNLYSQKELKLLDGLDGKYHRPLNDVGSFETSALIDRVSDTLIAAGSNGMLYLEALNTNFDYNANVMTISPSVTVMNSKAKGQKNTALMAVESSPAAYDKYVFYADMGGVLRCIDTNTLTPVWAVETGDSVMAAIAMDLTDTRELNLYTANMLNNRKKGDGSIQIRRYDALSGRESWCTDIGVYKGKKDKDDVGAKASPVIGQQSLSDLVFYTVTGLSAEGREKLRLSGEASAALIALDKETGRIIWAFGLSSRSESSPIAVYDEQGNGWIIQCEQNGTIHMLEGLTGSTVDTLKLDAEIEASPAAYGNVMVIGTTGKGTSYVYGIELRIGGGQEKETGDEEDSGGA